jgi:cytochrome b561
VPLKNTSEKFGVIAKSFHWVMMAIILMLLTVGFLMNSLSVSPLRVELVWWHKSFGILVLLLACGRLAWRMINIRPNPEPTLKKWEIALSGVVHFLLYVGFFVMPLSGWIMSSASDFPASFFGLFNLAHIVAKNPDIAHSARAVHNTLAVVIMGLIGLHVAGAFKHHMFDHDGTLRHMRWDNIGLKGGLMLFAVGGIMLAIPSYLMIFGEDEPQQTQQAAQTVTLSNVAQVQAQFSALKWIIDPQASFIKFTATQYGQNFEGQFKHFDAQIFFDTERMENNFVDVEIDLSQIATGDAERDAQTQDKNWFDTANHPSASFIAKSFEREEGNQYIAHGILDLHGVQKPVDLPFQLSVLQNSADAGQTAMMQSELTLNRLDFGIGQGEWQKTDIIGDNVKISIYVKARSALPAQ